MEMTGLRPIFLVHGAWHGAWCWRGVCEAIARAGGEATCVTLTGLGERSHLRDLPPTARMHVEDIRQTLTCRADDDAVLVLHSYGGLPGTAAAAALLSENPAAIGSIIYLDARVPEPGERWCDQHSDEQREKRIRDANSREDKSIPPPEPGMLGLSGEAADLARRLMTPHPVSLYDQPFEFDPRPLARVDRTFVHCLGEPRLVPESLARRLRDDPGWQYLTLNTGHDAMLSDPDGVAENILTVARKL